MNALITSPQNPKLKRIIQLRERKHRQATGLTIVEGLREIFQLQEASESGVLTEELFVCPELLTHADQKSLVKKIEARGVSIFEVKKEIYAKISFGDRLEGLLAVCRPKILTLKDLQLSKVPLILAVEQLQKPGNLGAILRTADAAGIDGLIVSDGQTDIYNPNVIRASLGAVFSVRVVESTQKETLKFLKDRDIEIYAATPQGTKSHFDTNFKGPSAIVLGSEEKGLSDFWLEAATDKINIPMYGKVDSLNVSTTAGILIYEALRQRKT